MKGEREEDEDAMECGDEEEESYHQFGAYFNFKYRPFLGNVSQ